MGKVDRFRLGHDKTVMAVTVFRHLLSQFARPYLGATRILALVGTSSCLEPPTELVKVGASWRREQSQLAKVGSSCRGAQTMSTAILTVQEAAALTGMSKEGIRKAITSGRLSASRGANQEWRIDGSELARVFTVHTDSGDHELAKVGATWQAELDGLRRELALQAQLLAEREATIFDLRRRLDEEFQERQRLTAVLESQVAPPVSSQKGFWRRLLRG
jgi:excisionase family DNA binding protein